MLFFEEFFGIEFDQAGVIAAGFLFAAFEDFRPQMAGKLAPFLAALPMKFGFQGFEGNCRLRAGAFTAGSGLGLAALDCSANRFEPRFAQVAGSAALQLLGGLAERLGRLLQTLGGLGQGAWRLSGRLAHSPVALGRDFGRVGPAVAGIWLPLVIGMVWSFDRDWFDRASGFELFWAAASAGLFSGWRVAHFPDSDSPVADGDFRTGRL